MIVSISLVRLLNAKNSPIIKDNNKHAVTNISADTISAPLHKELTPEERDAREKFRQEMDAFQELMNYNADKAYGIVPKE